MPPHDDTAQKITALEQKIDAIYESVEKTRKYFLVTLLVTGALVVLPAIGLMFAIPSFLSTYSSLSDLETLDLEALQGL